jgi:predicted MFS family arabinose efflux permease
VLADVASVPLLCALAFLLGTAQTLFDNAAQSILPAAVPAARLETANARLYGAQIVAAEFAGPPLGSVLFVAAAALPFATDAASFLVAALLVLNLRGSFAPADDGRPPWRGLGGDIAEGLRWLWRHRLLRVLAALLGIQMMVFSAIFSTFVLFSLEVLDVGQAGYGVLLASAALGSILGALIAGRLAAWVGTGRVVMSAIVVQAGAAVGIGLSSNAYLVGALLMVSGVAIYGWNVLTVSLRQAIVPNHLLGRVNSAYRLLGWGTAPIGAILGGALASAAGLRAPFLVGGALIAVAGLLAAPIIGGGAIARARAEALKG